MSKMWKTITTHLNGIVDKHCNYTTRIMDLILNIDSIEHSSYKNKAKLLQKEWKLNIHRSTVYLHKKRKYHLFSKNKWKGIEKLLKERKLECNGVFCYDKEFIGNKNQKYARLSLIDAKYTCHNQ